MWPRTEEERARKRNCGFVSFWRREDAVKAKMAMQDTDVEGIVLFRVYLVRVGSALSMDHDYSTACEESRLLPSWLWRMNDIQDHFKVWHVDAG